MVKCPLILEGILLYKLDPKVIFSAALPVLVPVVVDRLVDTLFQNRHWAPTARAIAALGSIALAPLSYLNKAIVTVFYLIFKGISSSAPPPPKEPLSPPKILKEEPKIQLTASVISPLLPPEIDHQIFPLLGPKELRWCIRVSKLWKTVANDEDLWKRFYSDIGFDPEKWKKHTGRIQRAPPLARNMFDIFESACPIFSDKKVEDTHILALIVPITMGGLEEGMKSPKDGHATYYEYIDLGDYKDEPPPEPYWVLMTKTVIPGSRSKSFPDQQKMAKETAARTKLPYEIPTILEATFCLFMEHVETGKSGYGNNPWTYTRTTSKYNKGWQLIVGGCSSGGFYIHDDVYDEEDYGVSLLRKS